LKKEKEIASKKNETFVVQVWIQKDSKMQVVDRKKSIICSVPLGGKRKEPCHRQRKEGV